MRLRDPIGLCSGWLATSCIICKGSSVCLTTRVLPWLAGHGAEYALAYQLLAYNIPEELPVEGTVIELPSSPIVLDDIDEIVGPIEPVEENQRVKVEDAIEPYVAVDQPPVLSSHQCMSVLTVLFLQT